MRGAPLRRLKEHAYRYAVLLGMLHSLPAPAPHVGAALRSAPLRRIKEHTYSYVVLMGVLRCMPLRPV